MKTERRHELKENELAHWLATYQTHVQPHARWVVGAVILAAVLWMALSWTRSARRESLANSWTEFVQAWKARDAEGLRELAQRYPRTPAAARALYSAGQLTLMQGGPFELYTNRADAIEQLQQARDDFQAALLLPTHDPFLRPQAMLSLAQAYEGLNELDHAKDQYRRLIESYGETNFALTAKQRLDFISLPDTVAFADWFAAQERSSPSSAATSQRQPRPPTVHDDLPISDDFMLPDVNALQRSDLDPDFGSMLPPESAEVPLAPEERPPGTTSSTPAAESETDESTFQANPPPAPPGTDDEQPRSE